MSGDTPPSPNTEKTYMGKVHGWQTQTLLRVKAVRAKYISRHEIIYWFSVHVAIVDLGAATIAYDAEIP